MSTARFVLTIGFVFVFTLAPVGVTRADDDDKTTKERAKELAEDAKEKAKDLAEDAKEAAAAAKEKIKAKWAEMQKDDSVVAVFKLNGPITEQPGPQDPFFGTPGAVSLQQLVERLKKAATDDEVKGVVIVMDGMTSMGWAQVEELRRAMTQVRKTGKPVYAHVDFLTTGRYALLSGASRLSVVPTGHIIINGMYGEQPYIRGLLDLLGVTPDFIAMGDYKSAAEMFTRKGPSKPANEMTNWLFDSLYGSYLGLIAKGRDVSVDKAERWIDQGLYTAESAHKAGIIDAVEHRQDFIEMLQKEHGKSVKFDANYGKSKAVGIDLSSPGGLMQFYMDLLQGPRMKVSNKDSIAVVYVEGTIMPGNPSSSPFGGAAAGAYSTPLRKTLHQASQDDSVKAVVLRINSPGGSAVASEIILDASKRLADKKPLIVSMGNVAGSGGYYVACGAEMIFADRATITGSIGVVGGKFATAPMWGKIGINWKSYGRGDNADLLSTSETFSPQQRELMTRWMNETYGVFKGHVVAARGKKLAKPIDELAGGRVFTGEQALELGLVDKIGTLDDAIAHAADRANLKDYEIRVLPKPKGLMELLFGISDTRASMPANAPGNSALIEAALPQLRGLEPRRVDAIIEALRQLSLYQHERVNLTMPLFVTPN